MSARSRKHLDSQLLSSCSTHFSLYFVCLIFLDEWNDASSIQADGEKNVDAKRREKWKNRKIKSNKQNEGEKGGRPFVTAEMQNRTSRDKWGNEKYTRTKEGQVIKRSNDGRPSFIRSFPPSLSFASFPLQFFLVSRSLLLIWWGLRHVCSGIG